LELDDGGGGLSKVKKQLHFSVNHGHLIFFDFYCNFVLLRPEKEHSTDPAADVIFSPGTAADL
jgi:hypothetical protein